MGIPTVGLAVMTNPGFPLPTVEERTTAGGVRVRVEPCEDTDDVDFPECTASARAQGQYRQLRRYRSDAERSTYRLTFRFNRIR